MLTAEHCVTRMPKGVPRREWVMKKNKKRNEALDIFGYNFAALKILNPNFEGISKINKDKAQGIEPKRKQSRTRRIFKGNNNFVKGFK